METGFLRTTKADEFLYAAIDAASPSAGSLSYLLFGSGEFRDSKQTKELLCKAAEATAEEVSELVRVIAPSLSDSIGKAWQQLAKLTIALPGWMIGESIGAESRAIWLRELLRELARYELPSNQDKALLCRV